MTVWKVTMVSLYFFIALSLTLVEGRTNSFGAIFGFPETRRGRATPPASPLSIMQANPSDEPNQDVQVTEPLVLKEENFFDKILDEEQMIMNAIQSLSDSITGNTPVASNAPVVEDIPLVVTEIEEPVIQTQGIPNTPEKLFRPRKVEDTMNQFGLNMDRSRSQNEALDSFPQLANQFDNNPLEELYNSRTQTKASNITTNDDVRCIPKVMQIEEVVYDRAIKCQHSYQEKCHLTYITDYQSTSEEKCETTFKKNCHITFKPMPFNETVSVCNTPLVRTCGNETVGPDICSTQYETNCETRYNTYEIEQDEPVCKMELMKKCKNVTISVPRTKRQAAEITTLEPVTNEPNSATEAEEATETSTDADGETLTFDQKCEEWPVQKCSLEKQLVKKVHPDTACRNIPREICVPNNCQMIQGKEICYDDVRMQVQNVPQEECDLQPEETCHMESVLVPRLVPQPNCVKVPKEICVNTKANPRKVKKPIVKEWCYRPSDLAANGGA